MGAGGRGARSMSAAITAAAQGGSTVPVSGTVGAHVGPPVTTQRQTVSPASAAARAVEPSKPPSGGDAIALAAPRRYRLKNSCQHTSPCSRQVETFSEIFFVSF